MGDNSGGKGISLSSFPSQIIQILRQTGGVAENSDAGGGGKIKLDGIRGGLQVLKQSYDIVITVVSFACDLEIPVDFAAASGCFYHLISSHPACRGRI